MKADRTWKAAARCRGNLVDLGFEAPEWGDLARGARPDFDPMANRIPASKHGVAAEGFGRGKTVSWLSRSGQHLHPRSRPLLRSQQGPMAGLPYTCLPLSPETTFPAARVQGVVPPTSLTTFAHVFRFTCRCGRPLDSRGHHRAAWSVGRGVWVAEDFRWRAQQLASAGRQGEGSRPTSESRTWTLLPLQSSRTNRRLEVVVDGPPPVSGGAQLAIDTTMVSAVRSDGDSQAPVRHHQRSSPGPSSEAQRADLPRVGSATRSSSACGLGFVKWRGRWSEESSPILGRDSRRPKPGQSRRS